MSLQLLGATVGFDYGALAKGAFGALSSAGGALSGQQQAPAASSTALVPTQPVSKKPTSLVMVALLVVGGLLTLGIGGAVIARILRRPVVTP